MDTSGNFYLGNSMPQPIQCENFSFLNDSAQMWNYWAKEELIIYGHINSNLHEELLSSFTTPTLPENRQPQSKAISTLHVRFSCINGVKQLGRRGSSCLTSLECDYVTIQPHQHCQCYSYDSPSITYGLVQKTKLTTVLPTAKAKGKHQIRKIHQHQVTEKLYVYEEESFVIVFNGKWLDIFVPECCFKVGFTCPKL